MRIIKFVRVLAVALWAAPMYDPRYAALVWSWIKSTFAWLHWILKDIVAGQPRLALVDAGRAAVSFGHAIYCLWKMFTGYPCKLNRHHVGLSWTEAGFCGTRTWRQYTKARNRAWAAGDYIHM